MPLIDPLDGATYPIDLPRWRGDSGGPLRLSEQPGIRRNQIHQGVRSIWRYSAAFASEIRDPVSMGEGCTPLIFRSWHGFNVGFKLEWISPTGSFKDRGASVMISMLRNQGIGWILEDSSGSGGGAVAAYAAAAGMRVKIFVPAYVQPAKLVNILAFGADVELIAGTRQDVADEAIRQSQKVFYGSHNWHPFFIDGVKTIAYEIWEDLNFDVPDNIIIPTGSGSNVLGCYIGFRELLRAGEIGRMPRLFIAQPENCCPIHHEFLGTARELRVSPTIAEGAAVSKPVRLDEVVQAVRRSGGRTLTVSEDDIKAGLKALGRAGFYVEPTCAMTIAALEKLISEGILKPNEKTILLMTGTGLKATQIIHDIMTE